MTPIESRLSRALGETAEARDVEVDRMRAELNDRLTATPPVRRRRALPALAAAAAVVVITGTAVGLRTLGGDDGDRASDTGDGQVDSEFTCPAQVPVDLSGGQDEFLPDLSDRRPADVAEEYAAPRWRFEDEGDTARLLLGNADGSLGSITTYDRVDGKWTMVDSTVCGDGTPGVPTTDALQLGRHGGDPWPRRGCSTRPAVGRRRCSSMTVRSTTTPGWSSGIARSTPRRAVSACAGSRGCRTASSPPASLRTGCSTSPACSSCPTTWSGGPVR